MCFVEYISLSNLTLSHPRGTLTRNPPVRPYGTLFLRQEGRDNSHSRQGFQARSYFKIPSAQICGSFQVRSLCNARMSIDEAGHLKRRRTSSHSCGKRRLHIALHLFCPLPFQAFVFSEKKSSIFVDDIKSRSPVEVISALVFLIDILRAQAKGFHSSIKRVPSAFHS